MSNLEKIVRSEGGEGIEEKKLHIVNHLNGVKDKLIMDIGRSLNWNDFYFAGGCLYCLWNGKPIRDYDIFFKNKMAVRKIVRYFEKHRDRVGHWSDKAITMGNFQFIIGHCGKPDKEVACFDFKHNCYWYDKKGLHSLDGCWDYIGSNEMIFNDGRAEDILNIMTRIPKFTERGMTIKKDTMDQILEAGTAPGRVRKERKYIRNRRSGRSRY